MKHIVIDARIRQSSTGRYMDRLLEHLQQIDDINNYTVILSPNDTWQPSANNFSVVKSKIKPYSFNVLNLITFGLFIHKLRPDLVHFTITPQEPLFYFGKRVTTTHDLTMLRFAMPGRLSPILHWLRMSGYRFLFWNSHLVSKKIIVPTKFVADDLANHRPWTKDKIVITYEASEPPLTIKAEPPSRVKQPFIMHVGSPLPHKNIARLIKAFEKLKQKHSDLQLVLPGKKEQYFEKLEQIIAKSPAKNSILVPGFVSDAELKWLYENAECYVLPSLSEGFGLPGLEAMAHGCPLVSSNATCLPEVYGDAAHYFDPENLDDMVFKIEEVISDKKLQKELIKKGHKQILRYSWRKMATETLEVYKSVL